MMQAGTKFVYHTQLTNESLPLFRRVLTDRLPSSRPAVGQLPRTGADHASVALGMLGA